MAWGKTQNLIGPTGATGIDGAQGPAGPIVPATATVIGAVKPGVGLAVQADGTLDAAEPKLVTSRWQTSRWVDCQGTKCIYSPSITQRATFDGYDPASGGWEKLNEKTLMKSVPGQSIVSKVQDAIQMGMDPDFGGTYNIHGITIIPSEQGMSRVDFPTWVEIGGATNDWEARFYINTPDHYGIENTEWMSVVRDDAKDRVFGQPACENLMGEFLFDAGTQISDTMPDGNPGITRMSGTKKIKEFTNWFPRMQSSYGFEITLALKIGATSTLTWDMYFAFTSSGDQQFYNLELYTEWACLVHMMPFVQSGNPTRSYERKGGDIFKAV